MSYATVKSSSELLSQATRGGQDRKKIPAGEPAFRLASVDLLELDRPTTHLARFLPSLACVAVLALLIHCDCSKRQF